MKKIIIIIFCLCPAIVYSQYPGDVIELNSTPPAGTIKACHSIILKPGFTFSATTSNSLTLIADESVCTPYVEEPITLPSAQNYIVKVTPLDETDIVNISSSGIEIARNARAITTVQYFDGLGRPVQTVQKGFTPTKNDLVILQEYDALGRESKVWLPAPQNASSGNYVTPATIKTSAQTFYDGDTAPYSKPVYENSPLNRVLEQYGPGQDWHNPTDAKSVKTYYKTNTASGDELSCTKYTISGNNLVKSDNYPDNELYVVETIDEDGNFSYVFTDKLGRTLLMRRINDNENHDIYYVYDDLNNLRFVLPPLAADACSSTIDESALVQYAYIYKYDNRNRIIEKKLPGSVSIKYAYAKGENLIFWQDGEMLEQNIWMFKISDNFGREALTGICKHSTVSYVLYLSLNCCINAIWLGNTGKYFGYDICYCNSSFNGTEFNNLTKVNFYDDYDFLDLNAINNSGVTLSYDTNEHEDFNKMYGNIDNIIAHKGLLTGSAVAMLESNTMLYSAFYYDYKGRIIQSKSTNHLGGVEKEYVQYDFIGNPLKKLHVHSVPNKPEIREEYENEYDHAGRLKESKHKLGEGNLKTIVVITYDEAGRLESTTNGETPIINYNYDIRSRLKNIVSTQFAQELFYTFGGNIDEMSWRNKAGDNYDNYFTFEYDNLSRLTDAFHAGNSFASSGHYNEHFEYDKHGNIESLKRYTKRNLISKQVEPSQMDSLAFAHYRSRFSEEDMERGLTSTLADNLTMQYNGNQLIKVAEASNHTNIYSDEYFFMDWNPTMTTDYEYNANGAMTKDKNKGMTVDYNILNLPKLVTINNPVVDNGKIFYTYSADGVKRKVKHTWPLKAVLKPDVLNPEEAVRGDEDNSEKDEDDESPRGTNPIPMYTINSKTTDYVANKIYINGQLDKILLPNGYIKNGVYFYYVKDHISNNRVVIKDDNIVVQRVDYYMGSGLPIQGGLNPEEQNRKYGDLEFDTMHGLNWCDAHARPYMSDLVRTPTPDPHSENYYAWSPYSWCAGNLMKYIDPDGRDAMLSGLGTKEDPYVITAVYYYKNGSLDNAQVKGLNDAVAAYNNSGKNGVTEIKNSDGSKSYVSYNLSAQGVDNPGEERIANTGFEATSGDTRYYGNIVGTEPYTGKEMGSANNIRIDFNVDNINAGIASGMNSSSLNKGVAIHEIGHNLGGDHSDGTSVMYIVGTTETFHQIGGHTTVSHSYPSMSTKFTPIIFNRRDTPFSSTGNIWTKKP